MRITYKYINYPYSEKATNISRFRNSLQAGSLFIVGLLCYLLYGLFQSFLSSTAAIIAALVLSLVLFICFLRYLAKKEITIAQQDLAKQQDENKTQE